MKRIPNGSYTKEFKEEAVKLVTEGGLSVTEVGSRLSLPKSTMANWIRAYEAGKLGEVASYVMAERMTRNLVSVPLEGHSRQAARSGFDSSLGSWQPILRPGIYYLIG